MDFPNFTTVPLNAFRIDVHNDALATELQSGVAYELGVLYRSRIDRDFIATGTEQHADVFECPDAATDGQRHKTDFRSSSDDIQYDATLFVTGGNIEEDEFIRTVLFIPSRDLHGITGIAQVQEVHAFYDASGMNVQARDNAFGKHELRATNQEVTMTSRVTLLLV